MTELSKSFSSTRGSNTWANHTQPTRTVRDIVSFLRKRMILIGICGLLAAVISAWLVSSVTPLYQAGGQLLLGEQGRDNKTAELLEAQLLNNSVIEGELAILRSSTLLSRVVDRLNLTETPEFNPALRPPEDPSVFETTTAQISDFIGDLARSILPNPPQLQIEGQGDVTTGSDGDAPLSPIQQAASANPESQGVSGQAIRQLRGAVSVRQQGASFVVAVRTATSNPEISAAVANTLMTEYIRFTSEKRFIAARRFAAFLETRVEELADTLEASEKEALAFRAVIESNADSSARLEQQMRELTSKLVDARAQLAEAEARSTRVEKLTGDKGLLAAANVLTSDLILDLRSQLSSFESQRNNLVETFGEQAPQVASMERSIGEVRTTLEREVERTVLQLENTVQTLDINVVALESSLRSLEGLILTRSNDQIRLNQLTKVAEANRDIYEDFLGRYKRTSEIQNLQAEDAEVLSFATTPTAPSSPNKKVAVALSTVGGLILGIALAFGLELRPKRVNSPVELADATGLVNLGSVPRSTSRAGISRILQRLSNHSDRRLESALRILLKNIDLHAKTAAKSVLVTGTESGGAKSNLAAALAAAAASEGKSCLLVDADTRNASLSAVLSSHSGQDLAKVIYEDMHSLEAVQEVAGQQFLFLATTTMGSDPQMVFESRRAEAAFQTLIDSFDVVIIDAPPLTHHTEVLNLPIKIDVGLFTASRRKSKLYDLDVYLKLFRTLPLKTAGAVLIENSNSVGPA